MQIYEYQADDMGTIWKKRKVVIRKAHVRVAIHFRRIEYSGDRYIEGPVLADNNREREARSSTATLARDISIS